MIWNLAAGWAVDARGHSERSEESLSRGVETLRFARVTGWHIMNLLVHLYAPLNNTAGQARVNLTLAEPATIQTVVDALIERFGSEMWRHLYDTEGRIIPAWSVFVNGEPVQLNRPENLRIVLRDEDDLSFLMNIAGG
jgi:hypothetical protein